MMLHSVVLFLHVGAALGMATTIGILATYTQLLANASSLAEGRVLYDLADRISVAPKVLTPALVLTGVRLAYERNAMTDSWVIGGTIILALLAFTGARVMHPRVRDALRDAELAGDVSLIARRLHDPWLTWIVAARLSLFVLVVFLMTTKPGARITIGAAFVALIVATAAARLRVQRSPSYA